jgi:hypothetical protein
MFKYDIILLRIRGDFLSFQINYEKLNNMSYSELSMPNYLDLTLW